MRFLHTFLLLVVGFATVTVVYCASFLPLERTFPLNRPVEIDRLKTRDLVRHARLLQRVSVGGIVDFPVEGSSDPFQAGLYFTKVKLGSPPREFNVQIDTGSDVLWVNCNSCSDCPQSSALGIQLNFFDAASSSTAGLVACSDPICTSAVQTTATECSSQNNQCGYAFKYGDGSGTSGFYISDTFRFDAILGDSLISNASALIVFGPHYNLNLQSIAVNGQLLPIDPAVFATENNRGTIVDSGTTLAYLVEEAYDPFVSAVTSTVSQLATPTISNGDHCYLVPTSISDIFPPVILNFAGGASMVLKPEEYLTHRGSYDGAAMWCMGFEKSQGGITILGDLVLKDKIIVYDLARQRVGWASYDCSLAVNVSMTSGKDQFVNAGQLSMSISSREMVFQLLPLRIMTLLVHTFVFTICEFL
ncbi:aspartic proteinase 39 isoform X2 [Tripterygium wilfordii]|uniref:aspartic proteinase 39 isoform X2 n=1 Tax=Tripterygium wilfordii TaxID=458696 RepID=UPI0018F840E9|nr:aspartic proteinase 39 isoform X2 [Tripterygium wilfordii]